MGPAPRRVYIVDEHRSVRRALADRLGQMPEVAVVGETGEAAQAIREVRGLQVDVVLVEVKRGDGLGLELVRQLSATPEGPAVLVLTSYPTDWEERAARRAGAALYLLKEIDPQDLIRHILECAGKIASAS